MSLHEDITQAMLRLVEEAGPDAIMKPASVAQKAMAQFDGASLEPHIEYASLEHFKRLARDTLSRLADPESDFSEVQQGELFLNRLQTRYPVPPKPGEDPEYKPRDMLSYEEARWNVMRHRKVGQGHFHHADLLEAWNEERFQDRSA